MWVRGIDLDEVVSIDRGAEGVRVTFVSGDRKFVGGEEGMEVWNAWHLGRRLGGGRTGEEAGE